MKWYIKLGIINFLQIFLRIFYIIPIKKNRILFSEYEGATYCCNPRYIFEYLYKHGGNKYEYIWCISDKNKIPASFDVKYVKPLSLRHLYYLMTSKIVMANVGIEPFVPPRKGRVFINTWHGGGAYKKGGVSATYYSNPHLYYFKSIRNLRSKSTSYLISSNRRFSEIFIDEFRLLPHQILPIGMPRNDIFFSTESYRADIRNRICEKYGIKEELMIILYAPTYRGHEAMCEHIDWSIDTDAICKAVRQRFGKEPIVLYRCHMNVYNDRQNVSNAIDASDYPDMQELLVATDLLISDYSSLIWDFSLTYKPGFLYTPDLKQYLETTKLYTPIEQWQYPYAKTMTELCEQIKKYNEVEAIDKIKAHHNLLGCYEKGMATHEIYQLIESETA